MPEPPEIMVSLAEPLAEEPLTEEFPPIVEGMQIPPPQVAELPDEDVSPAARPLADREPDAKSGIPKADEFQRFFSKVVIRMLVDGWLLLAFRGIDEDMLSDRDLERIELTEEERWTLARPFAEFSVKSKFMRKHGRMIIASTDSAESGYVLFRWMFRVNSVAAKYRRQQRTGRRTQVVHPRQDEPAQNGASPPGYIPDLGEFPSTGSG